MKGRDAYRYNIMADIIVWSRMENLFDAEAEASRSDQSIAKRPDQHQHESVTRQGGCVCMKLDSVIPDVHQHTQADLQAV